MPGQINPRTARKTVDGVMNGLQGCATISDRNDEYSWQVDLRTLYDIEQIIINGKLLGKHMLLTLSSWMLE